MLLLLQNLLEVNSLILSPDCSENPFFVEERNKERLQRKAGKWLKEGLIVVLQNIIMI